MIRMIKPRRMRWAGHVARMRKKSGGKTRRKEIIRNTRRKQVENIEPDLRKTEWGGMD
jgi:hypothetical protein